jgi:hypothetical protein
VPDRSVDVEVEKERIRPGRKGWRYIGGKGRRMHVIWLEKPNGNKTRRKRKKLIMIIILILIMIVSNHHIIDQ